MGEGVGAIVVAAGGGRRMGGRDKIFAELGGIPILAHVIDVLQRCALIDQIVVVLGAGNLERGRRLVRDSGWSKVREICRGGPRRQDSVAEGLKRLNDCRWVVIHDGARPLITIDLIERGLAVAQENGAAIAAVPVKDTIKVIGADGFVQGTPDRQRLWAAQTPQVFRFDIIEEAYRRARGDVTDDAMLLEGLGHRVKVYMGSYENIKVTTPEDLAIAEAILSRRRQTANA